MKRFKDLLEDLVESKDQRKLIANLQITEEILGEKDEYVVYSASGHGASALDKPDTKEVYRGRDAEKAKRIAAAKGQKRSDKPNVWSTPDNSRHYHVMIETSER